MSDYRPDRWVVLKIKNKDSYVFKVLGGWSGSYLQGSSWRVNSGITKVEAKGDHYIFHGYSGSTYTCHKAAYGLNSIMASVLPDNDLVEVLPESDFSQLDLSGAFKKNN